MMQEILKPLLENNVLTDEVKESIEIALTEALAAKEASVRAEVEAIAKKSFESAKTQFESTYSTLEESYKAKQEESKVEIEIIRAELEELTEQIEELKTKPFINVSESDMEDAETKLVEELEEKYEGAFDLAKDKFNNTFDLINDTNASLIETLEGTINEYVEIIENLESKVKILEKQLTESKKTVSNVKTQISEAIVETEERMRAESKTNLETVRENLVTATEIFLEQELAEVKADKESIMKETQGRDLLESLKGVIKQFWDVDSEVAEEILEMKKESDIKVEQYKDMLKKEHSRLEESQKQIETLKKKVIVESKGSVLTDDKKEALEKLAENIKSDQLESQIDTLMESVINTFNAGFSKKTFDAVDKIDKNEDVITESMNGKVTSVFSSGDVDKMDTTSDELAELLMYAGVRK